MPPYDRVGLHENQCGAPLPPPFGEEDPKEACCMRSCGRLTVRVNAANC
jgi:hypothetical protein